jgi:phosphate transport system substrate-binding protein
VRATGRDRNARLVWAAVTLSAFCLGSCSSPSPPRAIPPAPIVLAGAENLVPLLRSEIRAFRERTPEGAEIRVIPNGSAEGMEQLVNNEVTMSVLTRELTDPEITAAVQRDGLNAVGFAWDAVAVIVHPRSPIQQISRTELGQIYSGALTDWAKVGFRAGGAIVPLTTGPRLGLYEFIQQALLDGAPYGPTVYAEKTEAEIVNIVASRVDAIGFVSRAFVDGRVKALAVAPAKGFPYVALSRESLMLRTYPLLRGLSLCTRGVKAPATANDFINFVTSVDGQQIVARFDYAPATVSVRVVRTAEEAQ